MYFERIQTHLHPLYTKAIELYQSSFPIYEQRQSASQQTVLADSCYHFNLIFTSENTFAGILLCWETDSFVYIEHFCIFPELRNQNLGQLALQTLQKSTSKPLILEIDPPVDDISTRRKAFYQRNGFLQNSFAHIHPPYRKEYNGHSLVVLSFPRLLTDCEYHSFSDFLTNHIMENVFDET